MSPSSTPAQGLHKIPFRNDAAEAIPPCAVVQITGSVIEDGVSLLTCVQPGTTFGTQYAVNGLVRVPPGEAGVCYRHGELPVAFDAGTPQAGEGWGPKPGQWSVSQGYPGWTVVDVVNAANKIALVKLD